MTHTLRINMSISIFGIAGASGSGKTTIAKALKNHYEKNRPCHVHIISTDNYYLPASIRTSDNFDCPDVVDLSLLRQHLIDLKNGKAIEVPIYDFKKSDRIADTITINPSDNDVIILEGIFALNEKIISVHDNIPIIDSKVYVDTPFDISIVRRIQRDVVERNWPADQTCEYYLKTMREMLLIHTYSTKRNADLVVDNSSKDQIDKTIEKIIGWAENKTNQSKVSSNIYFKFAHNVGYFAFSTAMTLLTAPLMVADYLLYTTGFHGLHSLGLFQSKSQNFSEEQSHLNHTANQEI